MVRVLLHNTTGIGFCTTNRNKETLKMEKLRSLVIKHNIDILGLTELNKRWSAVPDEQTIWRAINKWTQHARTYASYNAHDPGFSQQLYGGTSLSVFNRHIHSIFKKGSDATGWGRWTWLEMQGKNNRNTLIVTAYCPCNSASPKSV